MRQRAIKTAVLSADALSAFCYQLALMIRSGISSEESIGLLAEDAPSPETKALLAELHRVLIDGSSLSCALAQANRFPAYLLRMVEIGERTGRLEQVLSALSHYYQREAATQQSLRRAIAYPAVMAALIAAVFLLLVSRVLPIFQQVFAQLGVTPSPVARGLLSIGSASKYIAGGLALLLVLCALAALYLFRFPSGQVLLSRILSHSAPVRGIDRSRFASAMALMLSSGLALDEAILRVCTLLEHSALSPALAQCRAQMEAGTPFPKAVEECGLFSGIQSGLLSAGFRAGASEQAMEELARRCQEDAQALLERRLGQFEYALVALLCLSVGLVLLSVMLPLLGVLSTIG